MTLARNTNNNSLSDAQRLQDRTIDNLVDEFLRTKKSSETKKAYAADIIAFFTAIDIQTAGQLITIPIYDLSTLVINYTESFKKSEEYREDRVLNPRTVNRKAYALSSFFEFLVANYGYPRNPVKVFTPYSAPSRTSTDDLEADELNAIWQHVQEKAHTDDQKPKALLSSRQQMLIIALLMLSLRRNEVANVRRDDRERSKNVLTVYGKGQKIKQIPLPSKVKSFLSTFEGMKSTHGLSSPYIFSPINNNRTGDFQKPITGTYIFKIVKKVTTHLQAEGKIAIDKKITPHSFRTTFVKLALNKNATDIEIMNATGHSTSAMVKYYDARSPIEVNAANDMEDLF